MIQVTQRMQNLTSQMTNQFDSEVGATNTSLPILEPVPTEA